MTVAARCVSAAGALMLALAWLPGAARAQTIADYGRAQRQWIEASMVQNAARAAALAPSSASAPTGAPAPGTTPTMPSPPAATVPRLPTAPLLAEPSVHVSGVFSSATRSFAEIQVDGAAYLLVAGQAVPGTPWRVSAVAEDRVVLDRPGVRDGAGPAMPVRRIFTLTAAR